MNYLGIDYGRSKIGLAIGDSDTKLTTPLKTIWYKETTDLYKKIKKILIEQSIDKVVIGLPDGKIVQDVKKFGQALSKETGHKVEFQDETLTTKDAQKLSVLAGINRTKRKKMEDAYSAALILQEYLDSK